MDGEESVSTCYSGIAVSLIALSHRLKICGSIKHPLGYLRLFRSLGLLRILNVEGIEVVISANGSDRDGYVCCRGVGIGLCCDLIGSGSAIAESVRGVTGITVDGKSSTCVKSDGKITVLYLRVVATIVTDLNLGEINIIGTVLVVTFGAEGDLKVFFYSFLGIYNGEGIEVVISANGSDRDGNILGCNVNVSFSGDFLGCEGAIAKGVRGVTGITVNGNSSACLYFEGEVTVLYLRVIAAVVADLDVREIYTAILIVTVRAEGNVHINKSTCACVGNGNGIRLTAVGEYYVVLTCCSLVYCRCIDGIICKGYNGTVGVVCLNYNAIK